MDYVVEVSRRERKRQAVHASLLQAGNDLFRAQGISRTTIDDIAQAVDVARQTFFNHFPYKEALALELCARNMRTVAQRARALLEAGTSAVEVLEQIGHWTLDTAIDEGELAVVMARELLHPEPERASWASQQLPLRDIFEAVLEQAREEGQVREDLPLDVVASRLSSALTCMFAQILCTDREQLHHELAVCFDIVFNGITDRRR